MFSKIIDKLIYKLLLKRIKPEIIGYENNVKEKIELTGISNMTHISNKPNVTIGKHVFIGHFNYIDGYSKVHIGEGCQITNYVSILTHSSHNTLRLHGINTIPENLKEVGLQKGDTIIGDFTYIGAHSVIMPGSKLVKGCIVSAFSYVNGVFPDYSILRGQPAKIIGSTKEIDKIYLEKNPEIKNFYYNLTND